MTCAFQPIEGIVCSSLVFVFGLDIASLLLSMFASRVACRVYRLQAKAHKLAIPSFNLSSILTHTRAQPDRKINTMPDSHSLESLTRKLLPSTRLTHPPVHSTFPEMTAIISDLHVHPTIETTLHMLNSDLPSAHFLVRHMQAPPAVEGMLLHGILHRAEGDFPNAKAWISDVKDACEGYQPKKKSEDQKLNEDVFSKTKGPEDINKTLVEFVYGSSDPNDLVNDVESCRKKKPSQRRDGEEEEIEKKSRGELELVLEWCKRKFGEGEWKDASTAWVKNSEEINKISGDMVSGGKGFRDF
jgi:hypothetical protein